MLFLFYRPPSPTLDKELQSGGSVFNSPVAKPKRSWIYRLFRRLQKLGRDATYTLLSWF